MLGDVPLHIQLVWMRFSSCVLCRVNGNILFQKGDLFCQTESLDCVEKQPSEFFEGIRKTSFIVVLVGFAVIFKIERTRFIKVV